MSRRLSRFPAASVGSNGCERRTTQLRASRAAVAALVLTGAARSSSGKSASPVSTSRRSTTGSRTSSWRSTILDGAGSTPSPKPGVADYRGGYGVVQCVGTHWKVTDFGTDRVGCPNPTTVAPAALIRTELGLNCAWATFAGGRYD